MNIIDLLTKNISAAMAAHKVDLMLKVETMSLADFAAWSEAQMAKALEEDSMAAVARMMLVQCNATLAGAADKEFQAVVCEDGGMGAAQSAQVRAAAKAAEALAAKAKAKGGEGGEGGEGEGKAKGGEGEAKAKGGEGEGEGEGKKKTKKSTGWGGDLAAVAAEED